MTGISNRRGFLKLANNTLSLCTRQKINTSLIFLDLDKFKQINDNFGHAEGDKVLKIFTDIMLKTFREMDISTRLGGDEFVVLLPDTTKNSAGIIISRFREAINAHNKSANAGYDIAFSSGIVTIDFEQEDSIETLLAMADSLMYEDKREPSNIQHMSVE